MNRKTKIVATIGPVSGDQASIRNLIEAGMDVARLNFSHGTYEDHRGVIQRIRHQSDQLGKSVAILQDLRGPKIRTGNLLEGAMQLIQGESLKLTTNPKNATSRCVPVDFPELPDYLKVGSRVLLSDGHMELRVQECRGEEVITEIVLGGTLRSNQGLSIPGARINIPSFTDKDEKDLAFGLEEGVDLIAMSFVRKPHDIILVREAIARIDPEKINIPIIAKLERPEALENLEAILEISEGVMVARGDLGVELSPQEVPIAQKKIIQAANLHAKIVITATQMLESMIEFPKPTRAEASDVANAILDGSDAVMLSGETAIGKYPIQAVKMMDSIAKEAEAHLIEWGHWGGKAEEEEHTETLFLSRAAAELAHDSHVAGIAVFTKSGSTARLMSKTRPTHPILGFTPELSTYRLISLYWGVEPYLVHRAETMEELIDHVETGLLAKTSIRKGQDVVLICGFPVNEMRGSNLVLLHEVRG